MAQHLLIRHSLGPVFTGFYWFWFSLFLKKLLRPVLVLFLPKKAKNQTEPDFKALVLIHLLSKDDSLHFKGSMNKTKNNTRQLFYT